MPKFCGQCGNGLKEEAKFCGKCGARIEAEESAVEIPRVESPKTMDTPIIEVLKKKPSLKTIQILSAVCGLTVILLLGSIASSLFFAGYKKPIQLFEKGVNRRSEDALEKAFYYEEWGEKLLETLETKEEEEGLDKFRIHIKIKDSTRIQSSRIEDTLDAFGMSNKVIDDVKKAYWVNAKFTVEGEGEKGELRLSEKTTFLVIHLDGEWKILSFDGLDEMF